MRAFLAFLLSHTAILLLLPAGTFGQQVVLGKNFDVSDNQTTVTIEGIGLSHAELNQTVAQALNTCQVRSVLSDIRYRWLSSEIRSPSGGLYHGIKEEAEMFQSTIYDYTHGRTLLVSGVPFDNATFSIAEANIQPDPSAEETAEAARIAGIRSNEVAIGYMPPFTTNDFPNGTSHRILNLVIYSTNSSRLVSVNMNNGTVTSKSSAEERILSCEAPLDAKAMSINRGIPGTVNLAITQNGNTLWTMQAIRPSASSGKNGAGVELRNVKYKGKTLLYQAHVPILNVEYEQQNTGCGPFYRDWQWQEYPLHCQGRDVAPGFRLCSTPATTIVDPPHTDGGDFLGVAISIEGQEVVLKAQMRAGWYRYTSEWRFHVDGTLRPRFGFGGVLSGANCVCQVHHHHVYWRLDFDIVTAGNNIVREFNKPPIIGNSNYHDKVYEIRRPKDMAHSRHWEISGRMGETYALIPGMMDGTSSSFGVGDLWVLKYHANELDDGVGFLTDATAKANIDKFKNGELVRDTDVVLWYAAHFKHDQNHEGGGSHIVGPDIRPLRW